MKKLLRILPMLAFMLGLTAAVANQAPADPEVAKKEALIITEEGPQWIDITGSELGVDYECNLPLDRQCTRAFDEDDNPLPGQSVMGHYDDGTQ